MFTMSFWYWYPCSQCLPLQEANILHVLRGCLNLPLEVYFQLWRHILSEPSTWDQTPRIPPCHTLRHGDSLWRIYRQPLVDPCGQIRVLQWASELKIPHSYPGSHLRSAQITTGHTLSVEFSGEALGKIFLSCLEEFKVKDKLLCITTDNANHTMVCCLERKLGESSKSVFGAVIFSVREF